MKFIVNIVILILFQKTNMWGKAQPTPEMQFPLSVEAPDFWFLTTSFPEAVRLHFPRFLCVYFFSILGWLQSSAHFP